MVDDKFAPALIAAYFSLVVAVVAGVIAFVSNRNLERFKAKQARDVEAFRSSLTRELEGYKAERNRELETHKAELARTAELARVC